MNLVDSVVALELRALRQRRRSWCWPAAVFHQRAHSDVARARGRAPAAGAAARHVARLDRCSRSRCCARASRAPSPARWPGRSCMEGFLRIRIQPWLRRLISRGLAIMPAVAFIIVRAAPNAVDDLLVLSQVVLSLQLSFAVHTAHRLHQRSPEDGRFREPAVGDRARGRDGRDHRGPQRQPGRAADAGPGCPRPARHAPGSPWRSRRCSPRWRAMLLYVLTEPLLRRWLPGGWRGAPAPALVTAGSRRTPDAVPVRGGLAGPTAGIAVALEMGAADEAVLEHVRAHLSGPDIRLALLHVVESAAGRYLGPGDLRRGEPRRLCSARSSARRTRRARHRCRDPARPRRRQDRAGATRQGDRRRSPGHRLATDTACSRTCCSAPPPRDSATGWPARC